MLECHTDCNEYHFTCCSTTHSMPVAVDLTSSMTISDDCVLLVNSNEQGLRLFDLTQSLTCPREVSWSQADLGSIRDLSWSKSLNAFLILTNDSVYSYSSNQLRLIFCSSSVSDHFWSITVLGGEVFILYRSDTIQRYSLPSWNLTGTWSRSNLIDFPQRDQYIEQIRSHSHMGFLAFLIRTKQPHQWRIDLFDRNMEKISSSECFRMASSYPTVQLQPSGQQGHWTLINEKSIWFLDSRGHLTGRSCRKTK